MKLTMGERTIMASRFKAECLAILDEVDELKVSYTITKHGRPVAKLVPADLDEYTRWQWLTIRDTPPTYPI